MSTTPGTGRPRDPRIDESVLAATRELLIEVGYAQLSYERVARRAGASRTAMYRRWPSKGHLVHDAVFDVTDELLVPDTASFADDFRQMLLRGLTSYARPETRAALPGLMSDLVDPNLRLEVVEALQGKVREQLAARVARAVNEGQLRPEVESDVLFSLVNGALLTQVLAEPSDAADHADRLADLLLRGLLA
jgi:AcrR family transcriptional regulator